jgi:hypothetical protein
MISYINNNLGYWNFQLTVLVELGERENRKGKQLRRCYDS